MIFCQFRTERECGCHADTCATQTVIAAPLILISLKTQAIVCLFLGFVMTIGSAAWMETQVKKSDLINQEQYHANRN
jgi:hypothetical protein